MREARLPKLIPIGRRQLFAWRGLIDAHETLAAQVADLVFRQPPGLLVGLVRDWRAEVFRLVSREKSSRALEPFPTGPLDVPTLARLLAEGHMALDLFRIAHSSEFSEREDGWLIEDPADR